MKKSQLCHNNKSILQILLKITIPFVSFSFFDVVENLLQESDTCSYKRLNLDRAHEQFKYFSKDTVIKFSNQYRLIDVRGTETSLWTLSVECN